MVLFFVYNIRNQPIHLYDAYNGTIRASYSPYNSLDELESPKILSFTPNGQSIIAAGFSTNRMIYQFDISRPGKTNYGNYGTYQFGKTKKSNDGQKGIVSAIAFQQNNIKVNHNNNTDTPNTITNQRIFAVGTYSPSSIYIYDERMMINDDKAVGKILTQPILLNNQYNKNHICHCIVGSSRHNNSIMYNQSTTINNDHDNDMIDYVSNAKKKWFYNKSNGGITQLQFSPSNPYHLFSTSRRSNTIVVWDIRMLSDTTNMIAVNGYNSYPIDNGNTNQRIEFDINNDGTILYVGGIDSIIRIYDIQSGNCIESIKHECYNDSVVNGISYYHHQHSKNVKSTNDNDNNDDDLKDDDDDGKKTSSTSSVYIAATTGSRIFPLDHDYDDSSSSSDDDNTLTKTTTSILGKRKQQQQKTSALQRNTDTTMNSSGGGCLCLFSK